LHEARRIQQPRPSPANRDQRSVDQQLRSLIKIGNETGFCDLKHTLCDLAHSQPSNPPYLVQAFFDRRCAKSRSFHLPDASFTPTFFAAPIARCY
jgi:hypothetical protein